MEMEKENPLSSEKGQAMTEYALLAVMVITSSYMLLKFFPDILKIYYFYVTAFVGMPVG